jgi:hypothetical protein
MFIWRNVCVEHELTHFFIWYNFVPIREEKGECWELYICPSTRMEISDSHWKHFSRILYLGILFKFTHISRFAFKSDTNHLLFRWRHIYIYMIDFYNKIRGISKALKIIDNLNNFLFKITFTNECTSYLTYKMLKFTIERLYICPYMFRSIWTIFRELMVILAKVTLLQNCQ